MVKQNIEIIQQLYEKIISQVRQDTFDKSRGDRSFTPYTVSARPSSLKTFNAFFYAVFTAFPDFKLNIDNLITKGDKVMARYTISGTHKGDFMGMLPTNKKTTITGIDIFRLDKGKVIEHWDAAHQISALSQTIWKKVAGNNRSDYPFSSIQSEKKELSLKA